MSLGCRFCPVIVTLPMELSLLMLNLFLKTLLWSLLPSYQMCKIHSIGFPSFCLIQVLVIPLYLVVRIDQSFSQDAVASSSIWAAENMVVKEAELIWACLPSHWCSHILNSFVEVLGVHYNKRTVRLKCHSWNHSWPVEIHGYNLFFVLFIIFMLFFYYLKAFQI